MTYKICEVVNEVGVGVEVVDILLKLGEVLGEQVDVLGGLSDIVIRCALPVGRVSEGTICGRWAYQTG